MFVYHLRNCGEDQRPEEIAQMHLNSSKNLTGPSGRWIPPQELSPAVVADRILHPVDMAYNISVQTGEEFSKEFLQDRATSRIVSAMPSTELNYENRIQNHGGQNCQVAYEELTRLLGLTRMDSQCSSDMSDFASAKGSTAEVGNGSHINNSYGNCKHDDAGVQGSKKVSCDMRNNPSISEPRALPLRESESSNSLQSSGLEVSDHSQSGKVKFLCSFGGKILPRPSDGKLRYVGGDTRIVSMGRNTSLAELMKKTSGICNQPYAIKYQLPGEDLDALISVASDEDLQNMIEEYYGLERLGGSQRLRIFLIPLCESDNACVTDPSTSQQNNPEFQYVVAVNGIVGVDPSPLMNCNVKPLTSEPNYNLPNMGKVASFEKDRFVSPHSFQIIDGPAVPCASQYTKESQNSIQDTNLLSSCPPVLELQRDLNSDHSPLSRCETSHISTESAVLLNTAELPQNSNTSNSANFYCTHMLDNLISVPNPIQDVGVLGSSQPSELLSHSHRPSGDTVPPSLFEQIDPSFEKCSFYGSLPSERMFHSEKPLSVSDAAMSTLLDSIDSTGPRYGMPHAVSDSRLQDYVGGSPYCSRKGTSPSSSLSFPTTCLPGQVELAALEEKQPKLQQQNSSFVAPQLQIKVLNVEPTVSDWGLDMSHPPFGSQPLSRTEHCNCKIHCDVEKCQKSVEDKKGNKSVVKNLEENYTSCLTLRHCDANGEHLHNNGKVWEGKPPEPLCCSSSNGAETGLQVCGPVVPPSVPNDIKPPMGTMIMMNHYVEKTPDGIGRDDLVRNPSWINIESMVKTSKGLLHDEDFQHANGLVPGEAAIQYSNSKHADPNKTIMNCTTINPSVAVDEAGSNLIFDDHALIKSSTQNANFSNGTFLLGNQFDQYMDQKDKKLGHGEGSKEKEKPQNVTQKKLIEPMRQEPSAIVRDMNSVISTGVESSFEAIPHITGDTVAAEVPTAMATEIEHAVQDLLSEDNDFNDDSRDDFITDAMIAEMEADLYGLQIIKNADLEELRELGSGTYGTVYHGKWRGTDVAIKRIKKTCFSGRSSEQERLTKDFWREAQILSNLHHPNVVAFYGVVPDGAGGTLATVTEFMANGSLRNVLLKKDRSLDFDKKLTIAMDAAFGMEYLHSKNIVHFDLKCDNLLVSLRDPQRPVCKVGDFGLSRIKRNTLVSGGVRGTLPWMAPELLNGSSSRVSERVDVFSFGITMWEILTEEEPYANMHCGAIIGGIVKNTLRPPIPEHCDPEWQKLMERCWSSEPELRPSFTEIINRLRSIYASLQAKGYGNLAT